MYIDRGRQILKKPKVPDRSFNTSHIQLTATEKCLVYVYPYVCVHACIYLYYLIHLIKYNLSELFI